MGKFSHWKWFRYVLRNYYVSDHYTVISHDLTIVTEGEERAIPMGFTRIRKKSK